MVDVAVADVLNTTLAAVVGTVSSICGVEASLTCVPVTRFSCTIEL